MSDPQQPSKDAEQPDPQRVDAGAHQVSYTLNIAAPVEKVYAVISDPHRHHEFDGSGTVRSRARGPHNLTEGARFSVHMRKFGLPYRLPLTVTRAESLTVVEWKQPTGHRWRWELDGDSQNTQVTETYDASEQNRLARRILGQRILNQNAENIYQSLLRLREAMT